MTEIIGAPDIYVDRGSTLNVTCAVAAGSREPEFIMWSWKQKASRWMDSEVVLSRQKYLVFFTLYVSVKRPHQTPDQSQLRFMHEGRGYE